MATLTYGILGGALKGTAGNAVFVRTARGTVVRDRITPSNPRTPGQELQRHVQTVASRRWSDLPADVRERWRVYAEANGMRAMNAFVVLYKRLLLLDPLAEPPLVPPTAPFLGESLTVSVDAVPGAVRFTASGANASYVVTELLVQPLASGARRAYDSHYRHGAFVSFTASGLSADVPVRPGWVAVACRFLHSGTGQNSAIVPLGTIFTTEEQSRTTEAGQQP